MLPNNVIVILIIKILLLSVSKGSSISDWTIFEEESETMFSDNRCYKNVSREMLVRNIRRYKVDNFLRNKWLNGTCIDYPNEANRYHISTKWHARVKYNLIEESGCCEGYIQVDEKCIPGPNCSPSCGKGETCVRPNVCVCNEGYRMSKDANGKKSCVPVCRDGCTNGVCVEPDVCHCNKDYYIDDNDFICRPICSEECEKNNGHCLEPNVCSCLPGYKKIENNSSSFTCEPECRQTCINSHCVAPNICRCIKGYKYDNYLSTNSSYEPKCKDTCVHGTCTAGICTCHEGYRAVNATVCEPFCSEPSVNSICVAPEICDCFEGYKPLAGSSCICEPVCEMNCGNGTCTAPGVCTCDEALFNYNSQADPRCQLNWNLPCYDSDCKTHNVHKNCTCLEGYRYSASAIKIIERYKKTGNPYAFANELTLQFLKFFSYPKMSKEENPERYFSELICRPICDPDCINGTCIAPNTCG